MIAVSQTIRRCGRELLAVLVTIMVLVAPMAEGAPVLCENNSTQTAYIETSQSDFARKHDAHPVDHKGCGKSVCSLCSVLVPTPVVFHLDSSAQRHLDPQQSLTGLTFQPALGPPRSLA